jgi:DnaK suppressor protein
VKAPAKKTSAVKKPTAKKPVAKPAAKSVAKPAVKPAAKKAAPKPLAKAAKPATKNAGKTASKTSSQAPVKKTAPAKPVAKAVVKATKPAAKPVGKAVVAKAAPTAKPAAKPAVKAPVKAAKPAPAPTPAVKKVTAPSPAPAPKTVSKADAKLESKLAPKPPAIQPPAPSIKTKPLPSSKTYHAGFSQDSAAAAPLSGAAKASFTMSSPVLAPPLQVIVKKDNKLANNWKSKKPDQLTDAEVIAMPDSEYMNDSQLAFFRLRLVQLKNGILANADETTEHLREDTSIVPDPADRATIEEEHALELRTRDRERKLLKKIEQAIGRIDNDEYGYCDETGEPIGVARLIARPTATLSLEAQQRRELKQKMFGD